MSQFIKNSSWGTISMFLLRPLLSPFFLSCPGTLGILALSREYQNTIRHHCVAPCWHKAALGNWFCQTDGCYWASLNWAEGWHLGFAAVFIWERHEYVYKLKGKDQCGPRNRRHWWQAGQLIDQWAVKDEEAVNDGSRLSFNFSQCPQCMFQTFSLF